MQNPDAIHLASVAFSYMFADDMYIICRIVYMHIWYVYDMAVWLWFLHIKLEFAHIQGNHNGKVGGSIAIVWAT